MTAWHNQAVAAGEKRTLSRTREGELHSYASDEIGFARAGSSAIASSASGMALLAGVLALFAVSTIFLVTAPVADGGQPLWGVLVLTAGCAAGAVYAGRLAAAEFKAKRVRRERGIPEPSSRQGI